MTYKVEVLHSLEEFESIGDELARILQAQSTPQPFMTMAWLRPWIGSFLEGKAIWVVTARRNRELVGLLPLCIRRRRIGPLSFRTLEYIGAKHAAWVGLIEDKDISTVTGLMARELYQNPGPWDLGLFEKLRNKNNVETLAEQLKDVGFSVRVYPLVNIHGINTYASGEIFLASVKSRKKAFINDIRRLHRKLSKTGNVQVSFYGGTSSLDVSQGLNAIDEVIANSWQGKAAVSPFTQKNLVDRRFHRDLIKQASPDCTPIIQVLTLDGHPIAYDYGFLTNGHFTIYAVEYHEAYAAFSPGHMLHYFSISSMFDEGIRSVDFGIGEGDYKKNWCDWSETLYATYFFHGGCRSSVYKTFHDLRRSAKRVWFKMRGNAPFTEEH
jgi:CelD/BcsL family acetyltransferase involved in cellulose biosynthesis